MGGRLDAVEHGTLFARTRSGEGADRESEVVALDAESGEVEWKHGPTTSSNDTYTDLAVEDGVFFSLCGDESCSELFAFEPDGELRWTREMNAGSDRPVVDDGTVYVGGDAPVRAIDASTGETRWTYREQSRGLAVADVGDAAYVESFAAVTALDRTDGSKRWRYDAGERSILDTAVAAGVAYVVTSEGVVAVEDGETQWQLEFDEEDVDSETEIVGIATGRLFVLVADDRRTSRLYAVDLASGERDWASDRMEHPDAEQDPYVALHEAGVYAGAEMLRALEPATGSERWSAVADGASISSVSILETSDTGDHAVLAGVGESQFVTVAPDGERTGDVSVDGDPQDLLVGDGAYVATGDAIYALDLQDGA